MATLAALKKQIAALEAQVERVTKAEMGAAITKVRAIMSEYGLTIEHLAQSLGRRAGGKQAAGAKKSSTTAGVKKGRKAPKYRDPVTGLTWAGVGRAPSWIANASNRDDFLITKPAAAEESAAASAPAKRARRGAPSKRVKAAIKRAPRKSATLAGEAKAAAPVKRAGAKKAAGKKAVSKKSATKKVAAKKPAAKVPRKRAAVKKKPAAEAVSAENSAAAPAA